MRLCDSIISISLSLQVLGLIDIPLVFLWMNYAMQAFSQLIVPFFMSSYYPCIILFHSYISFIEPVAQPNFVKID